MYKLVGLQGIAALLGVLAGTLLWGATGAKSALCGGLSVMLPTAVFAWRLSRVVQRRDASHVSAFLIGEFVKIVSVIGILVLVRLLYPGAQWGAVVIGMAITLQANFFALLVKH